MPCNDAISATLAVGKPPLARGLAFVEAVTGPQGAIRVTYAHPSTGTLVVVKVFDPQGDDHYSIKLYNGEQTYRNVKRHWRTQQVMQGADSHAAQALALSYLLHSREVLLYLVADLMASIVVKNDGTLSLELQPPVDRRG